MSTIAEAFALLVVVATLGCGNSPAVSPAATGTASAAPSTSITTSLGIYSGRPDPSWDLTDAQVVQLARNSFLSSFLDPVEQRRHLSAIDESRGPSVGGS